VDAGRRARIGELTVCRLGFGAMGLTGPGVWGPPASRDEARRVLRRAVELGIDFIDTADSYGPEVSEVLIAEALHPYPEGLVIATKAGFRRTGRNRWSADGRPDRLRSACEASLRRLRLERIDLFQLHTVDPAVPIEESLGALAELREEGKVRHLGVSNVDTTQLERARAAVPVVSVQNRFSLTERSALAVLEACARNGIAFICWAPLAKGFLGGARGRLARVARAHDATPAQVALAWLLARWPVTVPIPGSSSVGHLEENAGALALRLAEDELAQLDAYASVEYRARRLVRRARSELGGVKRRLGGRRW
jgi:aryl-alcohol dehydrogenase-like predicted oxidoreductase